MLHTLNLRLFPEQLAWIVNHAEDKVLLVDESLTPLLAKLGDIASLEHVVVIASNKDESGYEELLAGEEPGFEWPELDAREVARHGITVNVVCPGPTDTPLLQEMVGAGNDKLITSLQRAIPLGRLGRPEDIAAAVAFLASDDASFITGQTLSVSGGLTMS